MKRPPRWTAIRRGDPRGVVAADARRTVIAIAHRLATLRNFDRVVVLQGGRIIEDGPPDISCREGALTANWSRANWGVSPAMRPICVSSVCVPMRPSPRKKSLEVQMTAEVTQLITIEAAEHVAESPFYIPMTGPATRPRRSLKHDDTFIVLDSHGDIGASAGGPDGLFNADTRYLARLEMVLDEVQPLLLGPICATTIRR